MTIKVGDQVPDFTLKDQSGKDVKLSALKGKKVLLSFHPLAWTPVCAMQMKSLEENKKEFEKLNVVPLGVSVDSSPSKAAWAKDLGIKDVQLVADFWPHGGLAKQLGLFREQDGISERANVLIDENGKVAWIKVYPIHELPNLKEVLEAITDKR